MTTETRADFARRMGWNRSSVTRAVQDGRVVLLDGLVDVDASLAKINALASPYAHHRAHAQQLEEARQAKTPTATAVAAAMKAYAPLPDAVPAESVEAANLRLKVAEANKREEEAKTAKLQRQILEREYVHVDTVRFALADHSAMVMGLHENMADRLTPLVDPLQSFEERHAAIREFANEMQREVHDSAERAKKILSKSE